MIARQITRIYGTVSALAAVAFSVVFVNLIAFVIWGPEPKWLFSEQFPTPSDYLEEANSRVSAALKASHSPAGCPPFVAILGQSSVMHGIDFESLTRNDALGTKYMPIYGTGGSLDEVEQISKALMISELTPRLTVFAIHGTFLIGCPQKRESIPLEKLFTGNPSERWTALKRQPLLRGATFWLSNSTRLSYQVRTALLEQRTRVLNGVLGLHCLELKPIDPWSAVNMRYFEIKKREGDAKLKVQIERFEEYGWFDRNAYSQRASRRIKSLVDMLQATNSKGGDAIVLWMPEPSQFRNRTPEIAEQLLKGAIARANQERPGQSSYGRVFFLDMRTVIDDDLFADWIHLNREGRVVFTNLLLSEFEKMGSTPD